MYQTLQNYFYWPNLAIDIFRTPRDCRACKAVRGTLRQHVTPMKLFLSSGQLEFVAMGILGPLPKLGAGHKYVPVITDRFSRLACAIPMRTTIGLKVADVFLNA